jgi:hypothetical protein
VIHNDSQSGRRASLTPAAAAASAGFTLPLPIVAREVDYAFSYILQAIHNESPWTYLKGFFIDLRYDQQPQASCVPCVRVTLQYTLQYVTQTCKCE